MSKYAEQIGFGAGVLIGTQLGGAGIVTPVKFGILQDISLDFAADLKELYGSNRYAIALAPGKTKVDLKAKFAGIRGALFNQVYFGGTPTPTATQFANAEQGTVPAMTTYTITAANSATWLADQGVFYSATSTPLMRVAATPTAGQYAVTAGVYTFAAADATSVVLLYYTYSTTGGVQIPITNQLMGVGPSFSISLNMAYDGRQQTYTFNNCQSSKLSIPTKQDDFQINELDFMVAADQAGNIGMINTTL